MPRPSGPKEHCGGRWTSAKKHSFIVNALRQATRKWAPIQDVYKKARVSRGFYLCDMCKEEVPATTTNEAGKRVKNVHVDHHPPVVPPDEGFTTWDSFIEGLFCEEDKLRVLCRSCHSEVTNQERKIAAERRAKDKENG